MPRLVLSSILVLALLPVGTTPARSAGQITDPRTAFGFSIGDDYQLANYTRMSAYWRQLDRESERLKVVNIGETEEGRPMMMGIVSSPRNIRKLDDYRRIAARLALAEDLTPGQAAELARQGKAVVWIDGGLHASETLGFMQLTETLYRLVSGQDEEIRRILEEVIVLMVPANPDGIELVADWYMREPEPTRRSLSGVPRLYQKYIGHDNNRDFYGCTQKETQAMNRVLYREWHPQILYNHHQSGPVGTVMFAPPFREPYSYRLEPLVVSGIDAVGAAMLHRFNAEEKPGITQRDGAPYSAWWNGGLRTTAYFHNVIGLLTETVGSPTPMRIPLVPPRLLPRGSLVYPIEPQEWRFRQPLEYSLTANLAVLDYAARHRQDLLLNRYRMGRNQIEKGRRDSWTPSPSRIARTPASQAAGAERVFLDSLRRPDDRDPRGFILPADQPDFPTAWEFARKLMNNGVRVLRASRSFTVGSRAYPTGSLVVRCDQAFRPHILDMFEPQEHPDDFRYSGGPPIPPYDLAGWTLAFQMGVRFDRILDGFDGPFESIEEDTPVPAGRIDPEDARAYVMDVRANGSFVAANRLLAAGHAVSRLSAGTSAGGREFGPGSFVVPANPGAASALRDACRNLGVTAHGLEAVPATAIALRPARIALWDQYGGSMTSGWTRFILERFGFPFQVVYPPDLIQANLRSRFDVILLPDGAYPSRQGTSAPPEDSLPQQFRGRRGQITDGATVPLLREFVEAGGKLLTIGSSTRMARTLGLPIADHLVDRATGRPLPQEQFYIPGSVLATTVDVHHPLGWGLSPATDVMFSRSPVFRVAETAVPADVRTVSLYASAQPLRSGWAWGQEALKGGAAVVEARLGQGRVVLYGPEVLFRAQPHGSFKLVFNALYAH